jgi:putative endonuclease
MNLNQFSYVYILASKRNGTLYVGVTSELKKRIFQHKEGLYDGFTKKYKVNLLMYYETYNDIKIAIKREKQLKKWRREWKIKLIEKENPCWVDLYDNLI